MDSVSRITVLTGALGVLSHNIWFKRGEHILWSPVYLVLALSSLPALSIILYFTQGIGFRQALAWSAIMNGAYATGLFSSILIYRKFFHPLRRFPGPYLSAFTAWYLPVLINQKKHKVRAAWTIDDLHRQYGEYVRVGPNALSIADPDMVEVIHAPGTKFGKAEGYDAGKPLTTLHQMRDKTEHDRRRRTVWDAAFTTKALRNYDSRVIRHANTLVRQLHERSGQAVNATHWVNCFTFDVMGSLAFGKPFGALESGEKHFYMEVVHDSVMALGKIGMISWLGPILRCFIPASISPQVRMLQYSEKALQERKANPPEEIDIMSYLLDAPPHFRNKKEQLLLEEGEVRLLIVAGSDTTSTTLTNLLYYLAINPSLVQKIRQELDENSIQNDDTFRVQQLNTLPLLNAVINETLRMHPPVPGGAARETPPGGTIIKGQFLPKGVNIITPMLTIQRSPRAFVKPNDFIPERWTTQPELILNKHAWFPFSMNTWNCIGKQLAYNELRVVVSKLVLEFDIRLADGETGYDLLENSKDGFTTVNGRLDLVFTARK